LGADLIKIYFGFKAVLKLIMNNCSLVISTYNWPEALDLCLKSVLLQTIMPDEIIIADDGSDARTKAVIEDFQRQSRVTVKHVWHEDTGFRLAQIRNKAVRNAQTDYIIQIDGDIILNKHFIQDHLFVREPGCFLRGTRAHIVEKQLKALFSLKQVNLKFYSQGIKHRFNAIRIPFLSWILTKKQLDPRRIKGCNLAFWKADFVAVNGYNNDLVGWGHEDEEFTSRLVNYGVFKKSVKLRCVQFHIFHKLASRAQEQVHEDELESVRKNNRIQVANGYKEVN